MNFVEQVESLKLRSLKEFSSAESVPALEAARIHFLGSHGELTLLLKQLGSIPKEERPLAGKAVNGAKAEIERIWEEKRAQLEMEASLPRVPTDFSLPGRRRTVGKLHPLTQVTEDIIKSFRKIG